MRKLLKKCWTAALPISIRENKMADVNLFELSLFEQLKYTK
jgi:hypothetical protein